jgi:hypothetical protein
MSSAEKELRGFETICLKSLIRTQCYNYNAYVMNVIPELQNLTNMQIVSFDIDMLGIFLCGEFVKQIYQSLKTTLSNNFEDL